MGRIKSKAIKRSARTLISEGQNFTDNFNENKKSLNEYSLPDKGTRNKIAGYITRLRKAEKSQKIKIID